MKKMTLFLLVFLFAVSMGIPAYAHDVPDLTASGTITFRMDWNGEPLNDGRLSICRVGSIVENDGNYSFALVESIQGDFSLENLNDADLAADLAAAAREAGIEAVSAPIVNGEARFDDVAPGLYVVFQGRGDASRGFASMSPFLISMPKYENGTYQVNVTADPKVPLETKPTEPTEPGPTKPTDPKLPQTGQLNWPVPVLAASGLAFLALGWGLSCGRKKQK